ncbi:MAG: ATP phosphoribosyltransferase regulatory subunit [Henriciella sp.]
MSAVDAFEQLGGDFIRPDIVLEAAIPLELSGEAVRSRICTFSDHDGREWALRPDLTLPVAIAEVGLRLEGIMGESLRRYDGPVFRLPRNASDTIELRQTGFERFAAANGPVADATLYAAICAGCMAEGVERGSARFGDLAIFPAFVDALHLDPEITAGLKRAFRQEGGVRAFLDADRDGAASGFARRLAGQSYEEVRAFVDDVFALTGTQPIGERSIRDISERLAELAASRTAPDLSQGQRDLIESFLCIDVPLPEAPSEMMRLATDSRVRGFEEFVSILSDRIDALKSMTPVAFLEDARFITRFGRRFTYYDGFVFDISAENDGTGSFAMGGRYDSLLTNLSDGAVDVSAIGGVVVPSRLQRLAGRLK